MPASPRVITRAGTIRGVIDDGIEAYRGIPYAAPTAGENRFRPPQPRAPWSGELDVTAYGKTCPQWVLIPERSEPAGPVRSKEAESKPPEGEDCLVLNVWTPNSGDAGKRPVMVWLHGGGFTSGSGSQPGNRGTRLARRGDVVVVTLNHRLGVLGFLELAELGGAEYADSGNAGALDMVAALEWVRDEIAAFGGDPENVTIFGCSGGGGKVSTLLGMPRADALYRRAIIESGPVLHGIPLREATGTARAVLEALGLDDADVKALSDVPASELVAASNACSPMSCRDCSPTPVGTASDRWSTGGASRLIPSIRPHRHRPQTSRSSSAATRTSWPFSPCWSRISNPVTPRSISASSGPSPAIEATTCSTCTGGPVPAQPAWIWRWRP